jgi:peptidoglycan hydrolase-like protein with peptidoglycan-binding domain
MNRGPGFFAVMITAALFLNGIDLAAQSFSRKLETRRERMNGADVRALQERLLRSGFAGVGEADGYYGPKTEKAIRDIQNFAGFEQTGTVDRSLWDFIFTDSAGTLALIGIVSAYDKNTLLPVEGSESYGYWNYFCYNFTLYFANDGELKILTIDGGTGDTGYSENYYFVSQDRFIAVSDHSNVHGDFRRDVYIRNEESIHRNGYTPSFTEDGQRQLQPRRLENYEPDFNPDDTLLAILYKLRPQGGSN